MSDMRFIILGIALIFVGFIILGAFGHEYQAATLESNEFGMFIQNNGSNNIFWINFSIHHIGNNFINQRSQRRLGQ